MLLLKSPEFSGRGPCPQYRFFNNTRVRREPAYSLQAERFKTRMWCIRVHRAVSSDLRRRSGEARRARRRRREAVRQPLAVVAAVYALPSERPRAGPALALFGARVARLRGVRLATGGVRRSAPGAPAPVATQQNDLHALTRPRSLSSGAVLDAFRRDGPLAWHMRHCVSFLAWRSPVDVEVSRQRAAPSKGQSQSPASSIARHACPRECGASPRGRTRRPVSSAPFRRACPDGPARP